MRPPPSSIFLLKTQSTAQSICLPQQQKTHASVASSGSRPTQLPGPPRRVVSGSTHCALRHSWQHLRHGLLRGLDLSNGIIMTHQAAPLPPAWVHPHRGYLPSPWEGSSHRTPPPSASASSFGWPLLTSTSPTGTCSRAPSSSS